MPLVSNQLTPEEKLALVRLIEEQQAGRPAPPSTSDRVKAIAEAMAKQQAKKYAGNQIASAIGGQLANQGLSAISTQGAAGYDAIAAKFPELFGQQVAEQTGSQIASSVAAEQAANQTAGSAAGSYWSTYSPYISFILALANSPIFAPKKGYDQKVRDVIRNKYVDLGITNKEDLTPTGISLGKETGKAAGFPDIPDYNLFNEDGSPIDPLVPDLITKVNPISRAILGTNEKAVNDSNGLLVKAVLAEKPKNAQEADAALQRVFANMNVGKAELGAALKARQGGISDVAVINRQLDIVDNIKKELLDLGVPERLLKGGYRRELETDLQKRGFSGDVIKKVTKNLFDLRVDPSTYSSLKSRGVQDEGLAKRLGVNYSTAPTALTPFDITRATLRRDKGIREELSKFTDADLQIALSQLNNANFIRG